MAFTVALVGNPNCGKTTIFNKLTGKNQYVGNWPGVTVEKKEGFIKKNREVKFVDLPGIYSLTPYTDEEVVSRNFLFDGKPNLILNVVSGINLERNLYLTLQLLETNIPVVLVVSMMDRVEKQGGFIDFSILKKKLGCSVIKADRFEIEEMVEYFRLRKDGFVFSTKVLNSSELQNKEKNRIRSIGILEECKIEEGLPLKEEEILKINPILKEASTFFKGDLKAEIVKNRYEQIEKILKNCVKNSEDFFRKTDRIDSFLINKFLAIPIFFVVLGFIYFFCVDLLGRPISNFLETFLKENFAVYVGDFLNSLDIPFFLNSLIIDGILSGVGMVLTFVPQVFFLFLFLSLLEDCGYMTRVAFVFDRLFLKFGLSGKSVISFLVSSGCGVNGIMATKTIKDERSRFLTILTTTFIPCNAKLPIIFVICSYIFRGSALTVIFIYFLCILAVFVLCTILKKYDGTVKKANNFVMEFSPYNIPNLKNTLYYTFLNVKSFILKAGTVIFLASIFIWFLINFGFKNGSFCFVSQEDSILSSFGRILAPLFYPLGFGKWQAVVATLSGIFAKENVVNTFGVILKSAQNENSVTALKNVFGGDFASFSFLIFNMLCAPCFAAIAAINKQMGNFKYTSKILFLQTMCAYATSFIIYQICGFIFGEVVFSLYTNLAIISLISIIFLIFVPKEKRKKI